MAGPDHWRTPRPGAEARPGEDLAQRPWRAMVRAMSSSDSSSPSTQDGQEPIAAAKGRQLRSDSLQPGLHIVSTPIGNLRDITLRALDILAQADEVLAEDTRTARRLLDAHGLRARLSAYHDHNGAERRPELLRRLRDGAALALISDAGTPLVSDPGFKLVREAAEAGVPVRAVPGPSALLAGLVTSGLPSDRFLFAGFLPTRPTARRREIASLAGVPATLILYESGPRLPACLSDLSDGLGPEREAAVARELTKLFEETRRGRLGDLARHYDAAGSPKGEIVILVGPPPTDAPPDETALDAALAEALARLPVKQAANEVAARFGIGKRDMYQRALALKDGAEPGGA